MFYTSAGYYFQCEFYITTVTLSIVYLDEAGIRQSVEMLGSDLVSFTQTSFDTIITGKTQDNQLGKLVVRDLIAIEAIKRNWKHLRLVRPGQPFLGTGRGRLLMAVLIFVGILVTGYFLLVPWLGEKMANSVSREWETDLGNKMFESMKGELTIDETQTLRIREFYNQTGFDIAYPVKITVVKQEEINAFAMPGGNIVVYSEMLDRIESPEQLAALLAHEASHIQQRHSLRTIFRSLAQNMFLMLLTGNESGIAAFISSKAADLQSLSYSRSLETEADIYGLKLLSTNNIDPSGMATLLEMLKSSTGTYEPISFLNTHPIFDDRIEKVQSEAKLLTFTPVNNDALKMAFQRLKRSY